MTHTSDASFSFTSSLHGATKVRLRVEGKKGSENTDHPNEMGCFIGQDRPYLMKLDNKRVAMHSVITKRYLNNFPRK